MRPRRGVTLAPVLAVGLLVALSGTSAWSQEHGGGHHHGPPSRAAVIEATGSGSVTMAPDEASLALGVTTEQPTARQATAQNAQRMTAILEALASAGFRPPEVSTEAVRLAPVYDQRPNQPARLTGYRATSQVHVRTSRPAALGEALDAAVGAGANVASGLAFGLRDPREAQLAALRAAVEDAQRRVAAMAERLGRKVSRVIELKSLDGDSVEPFAGTMRAMAGPPAPTPVEPGVLTIRARVHLRVELE
jgi:uncharacterized protein